MTIPSTARKAGPLLGTGAQTAWPFTFKVFAESDIAVTIADSLGVETALVLNTDYSVALNANQDTSPGGTVTYPISGSPLASGSRLTIVGDLDYDQPLDLPSGGNFSPLALENELDRLTMQIQQLKEQVGRAIQVSVTTDSDVSLPAPAASQLIGWDTTGTTLENVPIEDLATAVGYGTFTSDLFTGDGSTTQFTLSSDPATIGNVVIVVDGLTLTPTTDFTLVSGAVVFVVAPSLGAEIVVRHGEALPSGVANAQDVNYLPAGTGAVATTVQEQLREEQSLNGVVVVNSTSSATTNTAGINAKIAAGGNFRLTAPGTVYVSGSIDVPSNTSIYIGAGTTIKTVDGVTAASVFRNKNFYTAPVATLSAGELTYSGQTATLTRAGIGASFPVGSYIAVLNSTTEGWCGVFGPIRTSASGAITWYMENVPAATPAVGTITVSVADHDIKVWGPGTIDPNRVGTTGVEDALMSRGTAWFKVAHLTLDDYTIKVAKAWTNAMACVYDFRSNRMHVDAIHAGAGTDGINITSPARKIRIKDLLTAVKDNAVGLNVLDTTYAYTGVLVPCACGEMDDVDIDGIECLLPYSTSIVGLWGMNGSRFGRVNVSKIRGNALGAVVSSNLYAIAGLNNVHGQSLTVSDVDVKSYSTIVDMNGNGNWGCIAVHDVNLVPLQVAVNVNMSNTYTIGSLSVSKVRSNANITRDVIVITGGVNITKLSLNDINLSTTTSGVELMTSAATINEFNISDIYYGQGSSGQVVTLSGGYPVNTINISNSRVVGGGSGGALLYQSTNAALVIGAINVSNTSIKGMNALLDLQNPTQATATEINLSGVQCESCSYAISGYTPYNLTAQGYSDKTAMSNNPFGCLSSGVSYSIKAVNSKSTRADMVKLTAGALVRGAGGADMKMSGDSQTGTPIAGDQFWNSKYDTTFGTGTSKIGLYVYDGTVWTKQYGSA